MPSKTEEYLALAQRTANGLTRYWESWTAYLTTASRLYKYRFEDQLMIYAQRPDATACADYDIWNNRMNRYVRRGSKGIALLDESSGYPRLHYVFDVSDTGVRRNSRDPDLWQYNDDLKQPVSDALTAAYGISHERFSQQLADIAGKLVADYWDNNSEDIRAIVDGSFLMDYDSTGLEMQFKSAAAISVTYTLLERCGFEPDGFFDKDSFQAIYDFSTPDTVYALGAAVSDISREVLRTVERAVKTTIRRRNNERSQHEYAQNAEANEKLYQDWLTHERSNYFAAKKNTIIHDAFDVLMDSFEDTGKFDFSAVDSLSDELKSSDSYKQEAADVVNLCCEALVKLHQKCCISIRFVMQTIHNLQRFADIVPSIRGLDRHYDAFFPVDNADCSFLTDFDSIAEGLEAAKNDSDNYLAMVGSNSPLSRLAALKDILKSEDYVAAVSNLLFADQEVAPYAGMKKMILCLSMEETDEATALLLDTYCTVIMNYLRLSTAKEKVGKDNPFISASTEQILPIDLLIAQSIKSSKSGSPQEVDTNLDEFLEYYPLICTSSWEDQLFILQKVFAYLKMYSQERKVLEFLVKNNIPRTEQIDRRLNFLKNLNQNDISNAANSIEEFSIQTSDNEIAYDYRFISWTVSEINSYMNLLTSEDKTLDLPMVVAEWNKKIPQKNIRWSTDAMQVYLDKYLHENFGDLYTTKIKNCGAVLSNEVEYEPSVYIEATDSAKYPWLSFVVTGEQLTMTQVSFAIYALYLPTKDSQCTQAVDTIEQNQKYQNRLITLKQAQNPKIKNYIESINEILISGLEAWLNNNNTSSMYD